MISNVPYNSNLNLRGADLSHSDLSGAILSGANLSDANLTGANLFRADLTNVNLTNAILTETNLEEADLTNAVLTMAHITGNDVSNELGNGIMYSGPITGGKIKKVRGNIPGIGVFKVFSECSKISGAIFECARMNDKKLPSGKAYFDLFKYAKDCVGSDTMSVDVLLKMFELVDPDEKPFVKKVKTPKHAEVNLTQFSETP